jgi:hypothetical protein
MFNKGVPGKASIWRDYTAKNYDTSINVGLNPTIFIGRMGETHLQIVGFK